MILRNFLLFAVCIGFCVIGTGGSAAEEIYMRIHADGRKEFTNRPSGTGWIFYTSETGQEPIIRFSTAAGKPRNIDEIVREIAASFNIDASLVKAIIVAESNCNPEAISSKGAQGLMQLMPGTAKELNVARPLDPRENVVGGVKYIKGLLASFGDLRLALAADNAGPGAVKQYEGIPPYRETIDYVKKVIGYYQKFKKNPNLKIAEG